MTVTENHEAPGPGDEIAYGPGIDPERLAVCLAVLDELDTLDVDHTPTRSSCGAPPPASTGP